MTLAYILKLGFQIYRINVEAQKIDKSILKKFRIVLSSFQKENSAKKTHFFQKIFLLADISMKVIFRMSFFDFQQFQHQIC